MIEVLLPAEKIAVVDECDVCVVGGGSSGVCAAIRAARLGAEVVILEKQNKLGGAATNALVNTWHSLYDFDRKNQIIAGLTFEILERLAKRGAVADPSGKAGGAFNSEELAIELDEMISDAGIKLRLHTVFSSALVEDGFVKTLVFQDKSGRHAINAKMFIDATGDADLCDRGGFETYAHQDLQPMTTMAVLGGWEFAERNPFDIVMDHAAETGLDEGFFFGAPIPSATNVISLNGTRIKHLNAAIPEELTEAEVEGRHKIRLLMDILRQHGGAGSLHLLALPSCIGVRESKHVNTLYQLKGADVLNGRKFDDAVANCTYPVDVHHQDKKGITLKFLDGTQRYIPSRFGSAAIGSRWRPAGGINPQYYQLPLRSFIPKGSRNLLCVGRMIDADKEAFAASRVMVNLNQAGEAVGVAAYHAIDSGRTVVNIDAQKVRKLLKAGGSCVL